VNTAMTLQPSEPTRTQIHVADSDDLLMTCENDEVLSVADTATTLQPLEPTGMQIQDEVVLACVNTDGAEASVPSQCHFAGNATDAAQQPSTSSDQAVLDNDTDGNNVQRKRNEFNWLCNKRKRLRNSGASYVNKRNKWCKGRSIKVLKGHDAC